jgi:KRAB domain-containing zinc finger protein
VFKCEYCEKTFWKKSNYKTHLIKHTNQRPFKCEIDGCFKTFKMKNHLKEHVTKHKKIMYFKFCLYN